MLHVMCVLFRSFQAQHSAPPAPPSTAPVAEQTAPVPEETASAPEEVGNESSEILSSEDEMGDQPPAAPADTQLKKMIEAMAKKAVQQPEMIAMVREKKKDDPQYRFLQPGGEGEEYYHYCVQQAGGSPL